MARMGGAAACLSSADEAENQGYAQTEKPQALAHCGSPGSKIDCLKTYSAPVSKAKTHFTIEVNQNARFRSRNKRLVACPQQNLRPGLKTFTSV